MENKIIKISKPINLEIETLKEILKEKKIISDADFNNKLKEIKLNKLKEIVTLQKNVKQRRKGIFKTTA